MPPCSPPPFSATNIHNIARLMSNFGRNKPNAEWPIASSSLRAIKPEVLADDDLQLAKSCDDCPMEAGDIVDYCRSLCLGVTARRRRRRKCRLAFSLRGAVERVGQSARFAAPDHQRFPRSDDADLCPFRRQGEAR